MHRSCCGHSPSRRRSWMPCTRTTARHHVGHSWMRTWFALPAITPPRSSRRCEPSLRTSHGPTRGNERGSVRTHAPWGAGGCSPKARQVQRRSTSSTSTSPGSGTPFLTTASTAVVLSGHFQGPVVLLGLSLTTPDESTFFRYVVRASQKVGRWPMAILFRLMPLMARSAKTSEEHKKDLIEDFKQNRASDAVRVCGEYLDYIAADRNFAAELASSGNHAWVVHAEKGDGGFTDAERATLQAAPNVTLVTIPGAVFLLPDEAPQQTAAAIADALTRAT
jgi:hypothetical protein